MTFRQVYTHFFKQFGRTTPKERLAERQVLTAPWTLAQGFEALIFQIENTATYLRFAGSPVADSNMVDSFMICIRKTGVFQASEDRWELLDPADKQWRHVRNFWGPEYIRIKPSVTAQQHGFGMNAADIEGEEERYNATVDRFSAAHAATQGNAANQSATILAQQSQIQQMQQTMQQLQMANSVAQQQQYQQPQILYQQPRRNGGRGGGGRGGRGRGNNNNGRGWQQQACQQMQ